MKPYHGQQKGLKLGSVTLLSITTGVYNKLETASMFQAQRLMKWYLTFGQEVGHGRYK